MRSALPSLQDANPMKSKLTVRSDVTSMISSLFGSFFCLFFYPAAALIDHYVRLIAGPNPWMLSVYVLWKTSTI